jgi:splicing factor U2AF subunit
MDEVRYSMLGLQNQSTRDAKFGTEKDKIKYVLFERTTNLSSCSFFYKIGACRHGESCSRRHMKPSHSNTLLMTNLYQNPANDPSFGPMTEEQLDEHFDLFYEDIFVELAKYGEVDDIIVCDNVGDHLVGNVYVKYRREEDCGKAAKSLNERFYAGRPIYAELSPVTDLREARCRQYENGLCDRGGLCNFMHVRPVPKTVRVHLISLLVCWLMI